MRALLALLLVWIAGCGTGSGPVTPDTSDPFKDIRGSVPLGQSGNEGVLVVFDEDQAKIRMQFVDSRSSESRRSVELISINEEVRTAKEPKLLPDFKVWLKSDPDGQLEEVRFGQRSLGGGEKSLERLNASIRELISGSVYTDEIVVAIEADGYGGRMTPRLRYDWVVRAIVACTVERSKERLVLHVKKVSVDPPSSPVPGVKVVGNVRKR